MSRGQQTARSVHGGGVAQLDPGEIAQVGGGQRALMVRGKDDGTVETTSTDLVNSRDVAPGVAWQPLIRVHPRCPIDHDVVDVWVKVGNLGADWACQEGQVGERQRLTKRMNGWSSQDDVAKVVKADDQQSTNRQPSRVHCR